MRKLLTNFVDSAKEFTNLRSLITAALLVALKTILTVFVSIQVTESVRISISFVCSVIIGAFYGPVMGFVTGGLSDIIQFLIKPTGAFNPGLTLNACLAGFIYGLFFYGKFPKKIPSKESGKEFSKTLKRVLQILSSLLAIGAILPIAIERPFNEGKSILIVGIIILVASATLIPLSFLKKNTISFIVSILTISVSALVFYSERKTITMPQEFVISLIILGVYAFVSIYLLFAESNMDIPFLLLCILVMIVDAVCVNIFLGTFWISKMIGTNYWVLFVPRMIKNLVQLPINVILSYYVLYFAKTAIKKK